jgi:hypothetical protein
MTQIEKDNENAQSLVSEKAVGFPFSPVAGFGYPMNLLVL